MGFGKKTNKQKEQPAKKKRVRIQEFSEHESSDGKRTLPTKVFERQTIELKLSYKTSHRRIVVNERLSYYGLLREIKKLFDVTGKVSVCYEDDEQDIVKLSSSIEVKAMLVMTKRRVGCTRLFISSK